MSSNPFRKKALEAIDTARVQSPVKSSLRSDSPVGGDGSILGKRRTVKKVRVLSPPPLSPESPEWPEIVNRSGYPESLYRDPFGVSWSADESDPYTASTALPPPPPASVASAANAAPPANPFSKTLQAPEGSRDMENQRKSEGAALKAGNLARHSLNVYSFKRLLLMGKNNDPEPLLATDSPASNDSTTTRDPSAYRLIAGENTAQRDQEEEASSASETSSADNSDRHVGPVSATSPDEHTGREKKTPPPPPSSRHGKSLRDDALKLGLPTDINKPLPPSPVRTSMDDGADSPFDRESAGKVPNQLPEHESEAGVAEPDAVTQPSSGKKSAPAPPPRRGHARGGSKSPLSNADISRRRGDEVPVGAASDETPARSGELRNTGYALTPPPSRRPHTAPRQITPTSPHITSVQSDIDHPPPLDASAVTAHHEAHPAGSKLASPPPRPPTRNPSVKRPASVVSVEGLGRRVSVESKARDGPARPPPPPPRQRGGSSGSLDALPRQTSGDTASAALREKQTAPDPRKGDDILADLDALQREVDALRGQIR